MPATVVARFFNRFASQLQIPCIPIMNRQKVHAVAYIFRSQILGCWSANLQEPLEQLDFALSKSDGGVDSTVNVRS